MVYANGSSLNLGKIIWSRSCADDSNHFIRIRDSEGNEVNEIVMTMYIDSVTYTFESDLPDGDWTIYPDPPKGVSFSMAKRTWSGSPSVLMPQTQFNVTVFSRKTNETVSRLFNVESVFCKEGFYIIRHIDYTSKASFTLQQGDTVLESIDVTYRVNDRYFCIPLQPVNMTFNCESSSATYCLATLVSTDNITYATLTPAYGASSQSVFSMKAESVPTITVNERELIITRGEFIRVPITVTDVHHFIEFSPSLPSDFKYDHKNHVILGIAGVKASYHFTVTASNEKGSAGKPLAIYIDECPAGEELVAFSRMSISTMADMRVEDFAGNQLLLVHSTGMTFRKNGCFPAGEYVAVMLKTVGSDTWDAPINLLDPQGVKLEEFQKTESGEFQRERFMVGDAIPRGSSMKYLVTEKVGKKWNTAKFKDNGWSEGSAGKWGSLMEGKSAYFRKAFQVSRGDAYSLIQIAVTAAEKTVIFLNAQEVATVSETTEEPMIISIPAVYLVDGWNVLAAQQSLRGESLGSPIAFSTIVFDVSLHLSTSRCLSPNFRGEVTADTAEDKSHPPADAFGTTNYWRTSLPATVTLVSRPERYLMPRTMSFAKAPSTDSTPTELRVVGLVMDHRSNATREEEIAHVRSPFFLHKRSSETILLQPTRPYNGFRVQFVDSMNHTAMAVNGIAFTSCQMQSCKRKWGQKALVVGQEAFKTCPLGYYGVKRVICGREDVTPQWKEDLGMCLRKYATKGAAFIDTRIRVTDVREDSLQPMRLAAKSAATSLLMVQEDQISFPYAMTFEEDTVGFEFIMRFTVEQEIGDYVEKKMVAVKDSFMEELRETAKMRVSYASIDMIGEPVLREPVKWLVIYVAIGVVLALVVAFAAGFFSHSLYIRSKSTDSSHRKQLKRGKGIESDSLIDSSVWILCSEISAITADSFSH